MLAFVNPTKRNLRKKIGLTLSYFGGGGDFAPQFTKKKSTSKPCMKLKFGILAFVNPTKRNLKKKNRT